MANPGRRLVSGIITIAFAVKTLIATWREVRQQRRDGAFPGPFD
jgi:hypothetical protein